MLAVQKAMQLGILSKDKASEMLFGQKAEGNKTDALQAYGKIGDTDNEN